MKRLLLLLLFALPGFAQCTITTFVPSTQIKSAPVNANFTSLNTCKPTAFSGAGVPGAIAASRLHDFYQDTTAGDTYQCFMLSGACTAVAAGNWVKVNGGGGGGGSGTVKVVGSGNLTSTALVTGGGTQLIQTPSATATMDASGNISTPGSVATGQSSGVAGALTITQGTLPSGPPANSFMLYAPTSIGTAYKWKIPAADASGCIASDGAGTLSITGCSGGGGITPTIRGNYSSAATCAGGITGQLYFATDTPGVTRQCNGTSYQDFFADAPITVPGAASGWTNVNSATLTDSGGAVLFTKATSGLGLALKAISATTDFRIKFTILDAAPGSAPQECGLWLTNGTTAGTNNAYGTVVGIFDGGTLSQYHDILSRNYVPINGSVGASGSTTGIAPLINRTFNLRVVTSGTTFTSYTGDGQDWVQMDTFTMSNVATEYGFGCDPRSSTTVAMKVYSITAQ